MKRNRMMKTLCFLLTEAMLVAALLLPTSCSEETTAPGSNPDNGDPITVNFLAPQISGGVEVTDAASGRAADADATATTRASSALPAGATVRVVAFGNITAEANPNPKNYVAEQTYYVKNGTLTPCTVHEDGTLNAETTKALTLPAGVYTFYAISPALPHKQAENTVTVDNGMDYTASQTVNVNVAHGMTPVALTSLAHQCVRIKLAVKTAAGSSITALSVTPGSSGGTGVTISGLQPAATAQLGTTIPVANGEETLTIPASTFVASSVTTSQSDAGYILPATSGRISLSYDLNYTDKEGVGRQEIDVIMAPGRDLRGGGSPI